MSNDFKDFDDVKMMFLPVANSEAFQIRVYEALEHEHGVQAYPYIQVGSQIQTQISRQSHGSIWNEERYHIKWRHRI